MRFKKFIEGYEIYGFETQAQKTGDMMRRSPNYETGDRVYPRPVVSFNLERTNHSIAKSKLGEKKPNMKFFDTITWGEGQGAIRLRYSTKHEAIIEKGIVDLLGNFVWVGKRMFNINTEHFAGKEEMIAEELVKELKAVDEQLQDSPKATYEDFNRLIKSISNRASITANDPLFYEETLKINDNHYIIKFGVRGQGVQARGQLRIEEVLLEMVFDQRRGVIHAIQNAIKSRLSQHDWAVVPLDFEFYFTPTQSSDEVTTMLSTLFKYY